MKAIFIDGPMGGQFREYRTDPGIVVKTFERLPIPVNQPFNISQLAVREIVYHCIAMTNDRDRIFSIIEKRP